VESVSCPDPYTAVFNLQDPFQGFVWSVANLQPFTGLILSKAAWTRIGRAGYEINPVGTGPFVLRSLTPNQDVSLVRNPVYWGPRPAVDVIDFKVVPDNQTAALGIRTGAIDIVRADPITAAQYEHTPGMRLVTRPALEATFLEINMGFVKPFDDVRVRRAMRYAIDYKGLIASVLRGFGSPGYAGMLVQGMVGFDASVNPQNTRDSAKAKALLKDAGVSLPVRGFFTTYDEAKNISAARFIAANFSQVGIELQPRPLKREALVQERIKTATPASIIGTSLSPDPDFLLALAFISSENPPLGLNIARYTGIDGLYDRQHATPALQERLGYLRQIQQRLANDVPAIELWQQHNIWLVNDRVQNYVPSTLPYGDPLNQVTLKPR
jgi:peptide/nickel transport system substrate-binding protein